MVAPHPVSGWPVSVIVPARNEEACLRACLESLVGQDGVDFETIVVDDSSTDRTREIALSFPSVKMIDPGPLPEGWTGKNNALAAGARQAAGKWLLFTDADTIHRPGSLARGLEEAKRHGAALLSYSPDQEVRGFWEKAVMPVIFAELASTYQPSEVSDPASPAAAANGQYLLISREAYDAVGGHAAVANTLLEDVALARAVKASGRKIYFRYGGHAAVANTLLEDVALARAVKASGRKIYFRYGGDAVRTRMYRSFAQLREGWTKNLALLFPSPVRLALLRLTEFVLIVGSAAVAVAWFQGGRRQVAGALGLLAILLFSFFVRRIRNAHFSWDANLLALFGLPLFSYLLMRSRLSYKRGRVSWKGRTYTGSGPGLEPRGMSGTTVEESVFRPAFSNKRVGRL